MPNTMKASISVSVRGRLCEMMRHTFRGLSPFGLAHYIECGAVKPVEQSACSLPESDIHSVLSNAYGDEQT